MTKIQSRSSVYALVQTKARKSPSIGWDRGYRNGDTVENALSEVVLEMVEQGLLTLDQSVSGFSYIVNVNVPAVDHWGVLNVSPEDLTGPLNGSSDRANAALWLWLLTHGTELGSYASDDSWGSEGQIAHLFLCGLDLTTSTAVNDDVWTEWAGTFEDGNRVAGVSGHATCNCKAVSDYLVSAQVESVTDLLRQVLLNG